MRGGAGSAPVGVQYACLAPWKGVACPYRLCNFQSLKKARVPDALPRSLDKLGMTG